MIHNWMKWSKIAFVSGILVFVIGQWVFAKEFNVSINDLFLNFLIFQLYAFVLTFANAYFFDYMGKRFTNRGQSLKRLIAGFLGSLIVTVLALVLLRFMVEIYLYGKEPASFLYNSKAYFIFGITVTIIISLLFHVFYFYKTKSDHKVTESQVVAKTETAKYEVLKSQLDPHFLFNSLNVLTSLISENPVLAEKFTTKLSKVYRYVLEQKNKDLISFDEELQFAKSYMDLLKMRFEGAVQFEIPDKSSNPDYKIVPLSLQILLENAVKHNVISSEIPLIIHIYEQGEYLIVENALNKKSVIEKSTKVGLKNIKDRYGLITKRPVTVREESNKFIIKLPLLTQKIKKMDTSKNQARENKYIRARKKVEEIKGFYLSLIAYCIVIPFLILIWYKFTPHTLQWFWFPMLGWGFGLVIQGFMAFGNSILGADWEQRKIKEIMEKENKEYWK